MSALENIKHRIKEFKPTSWAIDNKTGIYLLIVIITMIGLYQFITLPKGRYPDIVIPQFMYKPFTSVTRPRILKTL